MPPVVVNTLAVAATHFVVAVTALVVVNADAVFVTVAVAIHFVVAVTTLDFVVPLVVVSTIRRA